jgi:hypothetical protein
VNTSLPSISGSAREGSTLAGSLGKWSGSQPIALSSVWFRCDSDGNDCLAITAAGTQPDPRYTLTAADVGHRLRLVVTASNNEGRASATSRATGVVQPAAASAPQNTSPPTISGSAQEGQTLTGDLGQWTGSAPIDFNLYWQRCNFNGGGCNDIRRANASTYTLDASDIGHRIRLRVRAQNRAGARAAYSQATGVVAALLPSGAIRLPDGKISIPAASVTLPTLLVINELQFSPNPLRSRNDTITARFRIYDTRGYVVRDALVFVIPLPYGWTTQPGETTTGTDGWAQVQMRATSQLPRNSAIVMFVRARKAGENVLTGVAARRLVQMLVNIPR